jgi:hypothetical protein
MSSAKRYSPKLTDTKLIKRGFLLYIFLIPLFLSIIFALFSKEYMAFLFNMVAFLLFFGVIRLSKIGFAQEMDYNKAKLTKAPKVPYKQLSAYLLAVATFFSAFVAGKVGLIDSLFYSAISICGYWLYYGFDPKVDKIDDFGDISVDIVFETLQEAQDKIEEIESSIEDMSDKVLYEKIKLAVKRANIILDTIIEEPKDIRNARKFLIVYIDGIAKVTHSYSQLDHTDITPKTREKLLSLMDDVEVKFSKELERLKANNKFDLDVNIDVLKEQIRG